MKLKFIPILVFLLVTLSTYSQEQKISLSFSTAQKIMMGCIAYADSNHLGMAIAIYDNYAQLILFAKMGGASAGAAKVAIWKGLSASTYQFSTEETAKWNVPNAPDIATVPGGLIIKTKEGVVIGSIGVSGAESSTDVKCAEAGLKAAGFYFAGK
jgi:glc operon protein GlcG